jgi:hypothetical protein
MNPVPKRNKFISTVGNVLLDLYFSKLKDDNFFRVVQSNVKKMYNVSLIVDTGKNEYIPKDVEWTLDDIREIYTSLERVEPYGETTELVMLVRELREYIQSYMSSQVIFTVNKKIDERYQAQDQDDFIEHTIDYMGKLYNLTDKRTAFSKAIRLCIEIFWIYNVRWQRASQTTTLDDIKKLRTMLDTIPEHDNALQTGQELNKIIRYIDVNLQQLHRTPDINTRVNQLEEEVQELRTKVEALVLQHPPETLLFEKAPILERSVLLGQLARHT